MFGLRTLKRGWRSIQRSLLWSLSVLLRASDDALSTDSGEEKKEFFYGGQAVMEGVMMRGQYNAAISVRHPSGAIVTT